MDKVDYNEKDTVTEALFRNDEEDAEQQDHEVPSEKKKDDDVVENEEAPPNTSREDSQEGSTAGTPPLPIQPGAVRGVKMRRTVKVIMHEQQQHPPTLHRRRHARFPSPPSFPQT